MGTSFLPAVLFDLDGTLVDSLADIAGALNHVLEARGYSPHPIDDYRTFIGAGMPVLCERAMRASGADLAEHAEVLAAMRAEYRRRQFDRTAPYEGIPSVLDELESAGTKLAVLSNKPHPNTVQMVAHYFGERFQVVQGVDEDAPPKPDPTAAHSVLARLGVAAEDAAMVGDSDLDIQVAVRAGLRGVGCAWGFRPVAELRENGAFAIADQPSDLLEALAV